jgi:hypothetical protein
MWPHFLPVPQLQFLSVVSCKDLQLAVISRMPGGVLFQPGPVLKGDEIIVLARAETDRPILVRRDVPLSAPDLDLKVTPTQF